MKRSTFIFVLLSTVIIIASVSGVPVNSDIDSEGPLLNLELKQLLHDGILKYCNDYKSNSNAVRRRRQPDFDVIEAHSRQRKSKGSSKVQTYAHDVVDELELAIGEYCGEKFLKQISDERERRQSYGNNY